MSPPNYCRMSATLPDEESNCPTAFEGLSKQQTDPAQSLSERCSKNQFRDSLEDSITVSSPRFDVPPRISTLVQTAHKPQRQDEIVTKKLHGREVGSVVEVLGEAGLPSKIGVDRC